MQTDLLLYIALCDPTVYCQLIKTNKFIYNLAKSKYGITLRNERFQVVKKGTNSTTYKLFGQLHRDNDLPAVFRANGAQFWYQNNKKHRDNDLPAVIRANGTRLWYQNDQLHRDNDSPSEICANGTRLWYQNGKKHRDNDSPSEICANGTQYWYQNGNFIR